MNWEKHEKVLREVEKLSENPVKSLDKRGHACYNDTIRTCPCVLTDRVSRPSQPISKKRRSPRQHSRRAVYLVGENRFFVRAEPAVR